MVWREPGDAARQNGMSRESTYAAWLAERLAGAASIEQCRLSSFSRSRAVRGDGRARRGLTPLSRARSASKTRRSSPDGYGKVLAVIGPMATG